MKKMNASKLSLSKKVIVLLNNQSQKLMAGNMAVDSVDVTSGGSRDSCGCTRTTNPECPSRDCTTGMSGTCNTRRQ